MPGLFSFSQVRTGHKSHLDLIEWSHGKETRKVAFGGFNVNHLRGFGPVSCDGVQFPLLATCLFAKNDGILAAFFHGFRVRAGEISL